jgi:hypothetical protein
LEKAIGEFVGLNSVHLEKAMGEFVGLNDE